MMWDRRFITYVNHKYKFKINLPKWWEKHIYLKHDRRMQGIEAEEKIQFYLKYRKQLQGKDSTLIFCLMVFPMSLSEWKAVYADSSLQLVANQQGRVYAVLVPSEPPDEFLRPDLQDYNHRLQEFRWLKRMINEELPRVLKSFRFFSQQLKKCKYSG